MKRLLNSCEGMQWLRTCSRRRERGNRVTLGVDHDMWFIGCFMQLVTEPFVFGTERNLYLYVDNLILHFSQLFTTPEFALGHNVQPNRSVVSVSVFEFIFNLRTLQCPIVGRGDDSLPPYKFFRLLTFHSLNSYCIYTSNCIALERSIIERQKKIRLHS